ncbi:MAG: hypothetical protein IPQ19_09130 [Bacteroidetes bacterium]|nr:hypothetical protein [Bacteroidota bacterium]
MNALQKFIGQIAAFIVTYFGNIRLTSLYGVFEISQIPYIWSVLISMFIIILIINSFNLIDGINCLSGFYCNYYFGYFWCLVLFIWI